MGLFAPARVVQEELLDEHDAPRADADRSLRDLRRINRWLGGIRIYRRAMRLLTTRRTGLRVLDIGSGTSDLLTALDPSTFRVALDFKIDHLNYIRSGPKVHRVVGDAYHLPFRENAVDVVSSAHFFHHFTADENRELMRESLRVARVGVAINDTQRHYVPLLTIRLLGALRLVGRITRFDGPASVLRGYTVSEARDFARSVGAYRWKVVRVFPFRFGLIVWK